MGKLSRKLCLDLEFNANYLYQRSELHKTRYDQMTELKENRDICTYDYTLKVMNNHEESPKGHI